MSIIYLSLATTRLGGCTFCQTSFKEMYSGFPKILQLTGETSHMINMSNLTNQFAPITSAFHFPVARFCCNSWHGSTTQLKQEGHRGPLAFKYIFPLMPHSCTNIPVLHSPSFFTNFLSLFSFLSASASMHGMPLALA